MTLARRIAPTMILLAAAAGLACSRGARQGAAAPPPSTSLSPGATASSSASPSARDSASVPASAAADVPSAEPADASSSLGSLYDLKLTGLTDDAGRPFALDAQRGRPVVVSMFYAACPSACPALILEMKAMDAELTPAARENVRYMLVSFDPARDDVAALAKVRKDHALDARWILARTDEREVRVLATALGLRYRFADDGEIDHSTNLALVRPDGGLDVRVDGLGQSKEAMIRSLDELAPDPAPGAAMGR